MKKFVDEILNREDSGDVQDNKQQTAHKQQNTLTTMKSESNTATVASTTNGRRSKGGSNNYKMTCAITGQGVAANPKLIKDRCARYGVDEATLKGSYIGKYGSEMLVKLTQGGMAPATAIARIRAEFPNAPKTPLNDAIVAHIVAKVPSKDKKAAQQAEFQKRKDAAMKNLGLATPEGEAPAGDGATTEPVVEQTAEATGEVVTEPATETAPVETPAPEATTKPSGRKR